MSELLLELLSEEIPARMQGRAAADLHRLLGDALGDARLEFADLHTYAGPRRLTAVVEGLAARSPDLREERKGPRVGAPDKAVEGFLRGAGLASLDQAETRSDKKGDFYVAVLERPGRATPDIIADIVPDMIRRFPWPKSMRWGAGTLRWVRPLQAIVCVFDGARVPFDVDGLETTDHTQGHRLLGPGPFAVTTFADYVRQLHEEGHVVVDAAERAAIIQREAERLCAKAGLELVPDQGLLTETAGLAEWPVPLLGDMDPVFLDLPPEVIRLSMRTHQKYFAVRDPNTGDLAPKFVAIANQTAPDGGAAIAAGNARVLSARLNDARYFWDNDRRTPLADMAAKLDGVEFKKELGSIADKTERIALLARELAPFFNADPDVCVTAARLAKADLVSEMVYEFPELQGVMGRYYALAEAGFDPLDPKKRRAAKKADAQKTDAEGDANALRALKAADARAIADAIRDHYKPMGPSDETPTAPVAATLALADKVDTLCGFWIIDEKPTGSGDPYALRRAALGVVRILLATGARVPLGGSEALEAAQIPHGVGTGVVTSGALFAHVTRELKDFEGLAGLQLDELSERAPDVVADLNAFLRERLRVHVRDQGVRHDVIDAAFAPRGDRGLEGDLVLLVKRVDALGAFLDTQDGAELAAGYKRAANILKAEEKKDGRTHDGPTDAALLQEPAEQALATALDEARAAMRAALAREDFTAAMGALAALRPAVDAFFDAVTVNADDPALRENRLRLLSGLRAALRQVADFSKIAGA